MPLTAWLHRGLILCLVGVAACGGRSSDGETAAAGTARPPPTVTADISILMLGNSHSVFGGLNEQLAALLRSGLPGRSVAVAVAPGYLFLDERLADPASMAMLRGQRWSAVVLQAQKYSSSGLYVHSTDEAQQLIRLARAQAATPLLFPEWPRLGIDESARIWRLHTGIASAEPACVAPVPQAWDLAAQRHPGIELHAADGNHARAAGAYLAALMLHSALTGQSPLTTPDIDNGVDRAVQRQLRQVAADTAAVVEPRAHCPDDAPVQ